jgi:putative tryptophan/tyrosine transport system substrate-binding protein
MRRRDFIAGLGSAAVTGWPAVARAQRPAMPIVGFLQSTSREANPQFLALFRKGLSEMGYVEGRNVAMEFRYADNQPQRLPELAADLVRQQVALIAALGGDAVAFAAKRATTTIPIVFEVGDDPVRSGLVESLNRPGGNITGATSMNVPLAAKRLELLRELLPRAKRVAAFINPTTPVADAMMKFMDAAAGSIGMEIEFFFARNSAEIDAAFASMRQKRPDALIGSPGGPFTEHRVQIMTLAAKHGLPAIFSARDDAKAGGLMSYSTSPDRFRLVGIYAGRILKGEKPADLPVMLPTKFEFVINLQTARALDVEVPPLLLALADEVIE